MSFLELAMDLRCTDVMERSRDKNGFGVGCSAPMLFAVNNVLLRLLYKMDEFVWHWYHKKY